jgi:hypothetical protein
MKNTTTISVPVAILGEESATILNLSERLGVDPSALLAAAWHVAGMMNNEAPDWDRILDGNMTDDCAGAQALVMQAVTINAGHRRTQLKAA